MIGSDAALDVGPTLVSLRHRFVEGDNMSPRLLRRRAGESKGLG